MVSAAISWNSLCLIVALHGKINIKDYLNILGDHVHPMVQVSSNTTMLRYIPLTWLITGMKSMKVS